MKPSASPPEEYDVVILGSGEGGKYTAWTLAKTGMKVAVIERKYVGGSCPNVACLPSKNIIHSAKSRFLLPTKRAQGCRFVESKTIEVALTEGGTRKPG